MKPKAYVVGTLTALTVVGSIPAEVSPAQAGNYSASQLKMSPAARQSIQSRQLKLKPGASNYFAEENGPSFVEWSAESASGLHNKAVNPAPFNTNVRRQFKRGLAR